jgi:hypothetical protein
MSSGVQEREVTDVLAVGPLALDELWARLGVSDDPRWAALAMIRLEQSDRIGFPRCDHGSDHSGSCTVALTGEQ